MHICTSLHGMFLSLEKNVARGLTSTTFTLLSKLINQANKLLLHTVLS